MTPIDRYIEANKDSFMTMTEEQIERLHALLLMLLKDFDSYCRKNNLTYFMSGGTALGSLRNKGFIPWDDDADIAMPRKDLEILKRGFNECFKDKYILEAPNSSNTGSYCYVKIGIKGTAIRELVTDDDHCEFFVDIFPLEYVSNNKLIRNLQCHFYTFFRDISYDILFAQQYKKKFTKKGLRRCGKSTRILLFLGYILGKMLSIIPLRKWVNFYDRLVRNNKESNYLTIPTGMHGAKKETYRKDYYFPPKDAVFEDTMLMMPNRIEDILTNFYGDYMTPPPDNEKARHFLIDVEFGPYAEKEVK